jgi:hypothetical protein
METGYVSRLGEFLRWYPGVIDAPKNLGGTVSIPWIGEDTPVVIANIAAALRGIGDRYGLWRLFIGTRGPAEAAMVAEAFKDIAFCRLEPPSDLYANALVNSRFALIYGGYNSIIDILHIDKPAVVLMRGMRDNEQQEHLRRLNDVAGAGLSVFSEADLTAGILQDAIERRFSSPSKRKAINLKGAETAARRMIELLDQ